MKAKDIQWGPVFVTSGPYRGRIGYLDDEDWIENGHIGVVYFGSLFMHRSSDVIPIRHLRHVNTNDLLKRSNTLSQQLMVKTLSESEMLEAFYEYHYIYCQLGDRWLNAREQRKKGVRVFISHSSKDAELARWIAVDVASQGFLPWLDEWEIAAGESIPKRISEGIEECQAMIVALSPEAVESGWVEREWHTKYWHEIEQKKLCLIPALLKPCKIPLLLRPRKYANFAESFEAGMEQTLVALKRLSVPKISRAGRSVQSRGAANKKRTGN